MKNIAVFFGGQSVEHEISVITGTLTVNSLDSEKFTGVAVYVDKKGNWWTGESLKNIDNFKNLDYKTLDRIILKFGDNILYRVKGKRIKPLCELSAVINCMHGERGEDGSIAGIMKASGIPLIGSNIESSGIAMNKTLTKIAMRGLRVKTLPYLTAKSVFDASGKLRIKYPMVVKPESGGSSIGITVAEDYSELNKAINYALRFGESTIIEPCLMGFTEINCAVYENGKGEVITSECERPVGKKEVLSFTDKYVSGKREFPAKIDVKISDYIKNTSKKVYKRLGFSGIIRIDYFVKDDKVYLNEINSVPGSMAYYLFVETFKDFKEILTDLIERAITLGAKGDTVIKEFNSGILNGIGSKGVKRL